MYYALVQYPNIDTERIDQIRRKYDPTVDLIGPHVTIMFPVPESVGEGALVRHIEKVLKHRQPFQVRIHGFKKSWDHWLFLTLEEGNTNVINVIALYEEIYTGILAQYRRDDIEFIPHIGLGLFVKEGAQYDLKDPKQLDFDAQRYQQALLEAQALNLDFRCQVDKLHLVKLVDDFSSITPFEVFYFPPNVTEDAEFRRIH